MNEELQDFLKDTNSTDFLTESIGQKAPEKEEKEAEQAPANRRERRENKQLQWEREARIKAEARLDALSEASRFASETGVDERLAKLYGADNKEAIALHQAMREDDRKMAREEALAEFKAERTREAQEVKQYEAQIDSAFEAVEDEYNVDLTSNSPAARKNRNELIAIVQKLSPKDAEGNITAYADMTSAWEMLQNQKKGDNSRNKDIASRGVAPSGTVDTSKEDYETGARRLRAMGINV